MDTLLLPETNLPGVFYAPFLADADTLFNRVSRETVWDTRLQARQTATFGVPYNYSGMTYREVPLPSYIAEVCAQLVSVVGFLPNNCLANYYPTGDSTMGFHSDSTDELMPGTGVAIVSLGTIRTLRFRRIGDSTVTHDFPLTHGSLLYMTAPVQTQWKHGIPPEGTTGPRISLTFRCVCRQAETFVPEKPDTVLRGRD